MRKSIPATSETIEFEKIVVKINRCCKVVKGGKRFSFSALVTIGDHKGQVGYGQGKAKEVPFAVEKAVNAAKKNLIRVPIKNTTIPHWVSCKCGSTKVLIRPACQGTGIIAGAAVRAVLEPTGIKNVLSKVLGSTNPTNVIKATFQALQQLKSKPEIEKLRGTSII